MEIRGITFSFCDILRSYWQAINRCNVMYALYVLLIISGLRCQSVIPK